MKIEANKYSLLTMFGHICTDVNQGALPAMLPFLVIEKDISYASAAGLIFAANSVSSFIQPLLGYLGDRVSWPWLMGLGIFLAGTGLALIGFMNDYWAIFAAAMLSGVGIALFHPEGGKIANLVAGKNKGAGISIFAVGGSIGFALGPIIATLSLTAFGMKGTAMLLIPAVLMPLIILANLKELNRITTESRGKKEQTKDPAEADNWPDFAKVTAVITSRSIVNYGMITFIPLYFASEMLLSEASAGRTLTLFSLVAAAATLLGGHASDRIGFSRMIKGSYTLLVPLLLLFPMIGNVYLALLLLVPIAAMLSSAQGATIALGQKFLPNHIGTSSGIMLGLAVSVGGMIAPGIGWIGDTYGLISAMYAIAGFSVLTMLCAFLIPNPQRLRMRKAHSGDTAPGGGPR